MSNVSAICAALVEVLSRLEPVTFASADEFLPPVGNMDVCAFVVPFEQTTTAQPDVLGGGYIVLTHRLSVEFWIQHRNGQAAITMQIARDIGGAAIAALLRADGDGYSIARDYAFEERIEPQFVTHLGVPWLVSTLRVPVENEVMT